MAFGLILAVDVAEWAIRPAVEAERDASEGGEAPE
jgi:hypothetical protein